MSRKKLLSGVLLLSFLLGLMGCSAEESECEAPPCEPQAALETLEVVEGFEVELFAAEPLLRDPVAMEIDEEGRLYVVEDPGYPDNRDAEIGAVRLLEDTTGDGLPDESTVFAEGFRAPRGVIRWQDGILVTDASDIIYLEDTTGDGCADVRELLMTGFNYGNPQLGVNSPRYGLDNWIYVAHRQGGSTPHFAEEAEPENAVARGNIRFRPDTREWETMAASSQFGHSFDAFGRHLLVSNANHIYQDVTDARYLERNPDLLVAPASANISDHGAAAEVFPITENERHELFTDEGTFTAACGITCYLGGTFPSEYQGASFVAEPTHNLVHADRLEENGATLLARRMHEGREFLASRDPWFRPVELFVGPDGALYILDFYREVIEQPRFLSEEVLERGILAGTERGRIYRVVSEGAESSNWLGELGLGEASTEELVERLEHENGWWRRTVQRLLVDQGEEAAVEPLEELAGSAAMPETRAQALWTLDGMGALAPEQIEQALGDGSPRVREQAIRLAESRLDEAPEIPGRLLEMTEDADLGVRFQLLNTLGEIETEEARMARRRMLYDNIEDEWMQLAALSAGDLDYRPLFEEALAQLTAEESAGHATYFRRLGMLVGVRQDPGDVGLLVESINEGSDAAAWWQAASLGGLATGLRYGGAETSSERALQGPMARLALRSDAPALRSASQEVMAIVGLPSGPEGAAVLERAVELAGDQEADAALRRDAIALLRLGEVSQHVDLLTGLVAPREPGEVQAAAARALRGVEGRAVGEYLLSRWDRMTPPVREAAMETLVDDEARIALVLDAVEKGELQPTDVGWNRTKSLMLHDNETLRERARELLGEAEEKRSDVVERYEAALELEGDIERGRAVHERTCAACHQIGGEGESDIGPDLASVRNQAPRDLLVDILVPSREIAAGYEQWRIERESGEVLLGVITAETPRSVTLEDAAGQETTVPRSDIAEMASTGESLMPSGLEHQISVEEMADLIAFIREQ